MADSFTDVTTGPSVKKPSHDLKLTDINGNELGLILCDKRGKIDPRNINIASMPRTPLRTSQGSTGYDDMEPPYVTEVQQTWMGGRGSSDFKKDRSKFFDSYRMDTTREYPICGPHETDQSGIGVESLNLDIQSPIDGSFAVTTLSNYTNFRVRIENAGTVNSISIRLGNNDVATTFDYCLTVTEAGVAISAPGDLSFTQYSMVADESEEAYAIFSCNVVVKEGQDLNITIGNYSANMTVYYSMTGDDILELEQTEDCLLTTESGLMLVAGNEADRPDKIEEYTTAWVTDLAFGSIFGSIVYGTNVYMRIFEYKHQAYAIVNATDETTAPELYINGYRGAAKSNAGNLFKTNTNLTLTVDELKDNIIYIYNGAGEMELQPWRIIESNTIAGSFTHKDMWNIPHDTTTEFVILGTDTWTKITGHGLTYPVTDVQVCKDYVVFAQGTKAAIRFMREYNNSGTWTRQFSAHASNNGPGADEAIYADLLEVGVLQDGETVLWRARVDDSKVDYSLIGDWDATGSPLSGTMLFFDINKRDRDELRIQRARAEDDYDTDVAKPTEEEDEGYQTSLLRLIDDLTYQITETGSDTFGSGSSYSGTFDTDNKFLPYYVICGNSKSNITGMLMYGQPPIPHILKEDSIGSINNGIYAEIPLPEMDWVRSEINGKANMQFGIYLYFNLAGGMIERYYDMHLDDEGPTRDEGLPRVRQGEISCLMPYPGRYYASINAGLDGYSSILCHNGMGWHEIYRADTIGKMITNMYVQTIPGFDNADILYLSEGTGIVSLPIVINPVKQYDYEFFGYEETGNILPYVESSWIDFGLKDINKFFDKVVIFSDCTDTETPKGQEYTTLVYYKIDNQKTWKMAGKGNAYNAQEIELDRNNELYGKRIKLRVAMRSNTSRNETPRLKATVVKAILRLPVKRSWVATFLLDPKKDLQDRILTDNAGAIYDWLFEKANSDTHATPLDMNTNDSITDDKQVFIDPASINTFQVASQMEPGSGVKEFRHIGTCTIYEV